MALSFFLFFNLTLSLIPILFPFLLFLSLLLLFHILLLLFFL